jgi:hypothetical protein
MTGTVIAVNVARGMLVAKTGNGEYSVIELLGGHDVEIGDELAGKLDTEGSGAIRNVTQLENMDVIIQGVYGSKSAAITMIR